MPLPATVQLDAGGTVVSPERVTVKVNGVLPVLPSAWLALAAAIESCEASASSLRMVPVAAAVVMVVAAARRRQRDGEALDRVQPWCRRRHHGRGR